MISVKEGDRWARGQVVATWDPHTHPVITEVAGFLKFQDFVDGLTVTTQVDEVTGLSTTVVLDTKQRGGKDLRADHQAGQREGQGSDLREHRDPGRVHAAPGRAGLARRTGRACRSAMSSPASRRSPRRPATSPAVCRAWRTCSRPASPRTRRSSPRSPGTVSFGKETKGKRRLIITCDDGEKYEELIPKWRQLNVFEGETVERGEVIADGEPNPHDILRLQGVEALANYLVREIQDVYRLQGVKINDKHIEVIIRQMLRKTEVHGRRARPRCCAVSSSTAARALDINDRVEADGKQARTAAAGAARHHQGLARHRVVHLGGLLPGDHPRADRSGGPGPEGRPARAEGERHRRPADPGGHGLCGPCPPPAQARGQRCRPAASWMWAADCPMSRKAAPPRKKRARQVS